MRREPAPFAAPGDRVEEHLYPAGHVPIHSRRSSRGRSRARTMSDPPAAGPCRKLVASYNGHVHALARVHEDERHPRHFVARHAQVARDCVTPRQQRLRSRQDTHGKKAPQANIRATPSTTDSSPHAQLNTPRPPTCRATHPAAQPPGRGTRHRIAEPTNPRSISVKGFESRPSTVSADRTGWITTNQPGALVGSSPARTAAQPITRPPPLRPIRPHGAGRNESSTKKGA